jgi:hypothetical protein
MTVSSDPPPGNTAHLPGTSLEDLSPRFMAINEVEGTKSAHGFIIKFQFKSSKSSTHDDPSLPRGHVAHTLTSFLSHALLAHPDQLKFLTSTDSYINLQAISTKTEAELQDLFQVTIRPNANRAHEIRLKLETALRFNEFKKPIFSWLQANDF